MTVREAERLAIVEQRQIDLAEQLALLRADLKQNTAATKSIKESLDNLTGGKQALMWITGVLISLGVIIATYWNGHRK